MEKIAIKTGVRCEFIDVTDTINNAVRKAGVNSGICHIFVPHTTCGLTINENADPSVKADIISALKKIVPENAGYTHSEGNSDAHIKSSMMGHSLQVLIEGSSLQLGTWQGIYLCEFDGPRTRQIWLKIVKK